MARLLQQQQQSKVRSTSFSTNLSIIIKPQFLPILLLRTTYSNAVDRPAVHGAEPAAAAKDQRMHCISLSFAAHSL
jgi:hypothetical protein